MQEAQLEDVKDEIVDGMIKIIVDNSKTR